MALSGSFTKTVVSGYQLQLDWYATQDIYANTSTVHIDFYWVSTGSAYYVNSSASKYIKTQINGVVSDGYSSGAASLSGGQRKRIWWQDVTVSHNDDGTKSLYIQGDFNMDVTLSGNRYYSDAVGGTIYLDTIPRASSIASSINWTAGTENLDVFLNRASSSFTHYLQLRVQHQNGTWLTISEKYGIGASTTFSFTTAENTNIYRQLALAESTQAYLRVDTYQGATFIGTSEKYGTVYGYAPATLSLPDFNIGDAVTGNIDNYNNKFTYDAIITFGNFTKTITNIQSLNTTTPSKPSITWNTTEKNAMYNETPNSNSKVGTAYVSTYFNGILINEARESSFTANVTNSNPTFANYTYKDTNASIVALTGNETFIVQNKSTIQGVIAVENKAVGVNGASITSYEATLNDITISKAFSSSATVTFDFGTVSSSSNLTMNIKAIDSRGNSTTVSRTVKILPYDIPTIVASASRANGFDTETTLTLSGVVSALNVGGVNKNSILSVENPTTAPTLTTLTNASATLAAGTYYVSYSWVNNYGETLVSPEASITITTGKNIRVTIPPLPYSATSAKIYMNTVANTGKYQGDTSSTTYTRASAIRTVIDKPTQNTTGAIEYRYKEAQSPTWSGWNKFLYAMNDNAYMTTSVSLNFDNVKAWNVEFRIADKLSLVSTSKTVPIGQPILFIESQKKSIGVNKFPVNNESFEISGSLDVSGSTNFGGFEFKLGNADQNTRGNTGNSRAMVKETGSKLVINHSGDFSGGVRIDSNVDMNNKDMNNVNAFNAMSINVNEKSVQAVDSSGSNANGSWVRYTDGMMMCWKYENYTSTSPYAWQSAVVNGANYCYLAGSWTFPSAFASPPVVFASGDISGVMPETHTAFNATTTSCSTESGGYKGGIDAAGTPMNRTYLAIGRWK